MKNKIRDSLFVIVPLVIGFVVPYVIHIELNMFNATLVTVKDIAGLWIGFPLFCLTVSAVIYKENYDK